MKIKRWKDPMNKGHSLVDVFIGLAILSVFYLASSHLMGSFHERNEILTDASRLFHHLQYARNQAITLKHTITICGSEDFQHCSVNWSTGYMIFIENQDKEFPTNEDILYVETKTSNAKIQSLHRERFRFTSDGRCLTSGTIFLHLNHSESRIVILDSGRSRIQHTLNAEDKHGR